MGLIFCRALIMKQALVCGVLLAVVALLPGWLPTPLAPPVQAEAVPVCLTNLAGNLACAAGASSQAMVVVRGQWLPQPGSQR